MSLEFTKQLYDEILTLLDDDRYDKAVKALENLHPYDIAEMIGELKEEKIAGLFEHIDDELSAEILSEMEEDVRKKLIINFKPTAIYKKFISQMDSDDAADFINTMPSVYRRKVIDFLKKEIREEASDIISLLSYDEDSAGGLMAKELVRVNLNWTVDQCIEEIRRMADDVEAVYSVYVVDDAGKLFGIIPLSNLIILKKGSVISGHYTNEVTSVQDTVSAKEVAAIMEKYNLVALPVVDYLDRLVGRITIDDVVDFIREEAEEDYQLASGLSENVEYSDRVWVLSRARLPWLLLGLLGGIASSKVIGLYEGELLINPQMAFFIPLIAAMGGNAGVQSSAIVVQSIASKRIVESRIVSKLSKELTVALINGLLCSLIILVYGLVANDSVNLSITVSIALLTVIVIASVMGAIIPLFLNSMKIDPALATGPFITTTNDLMGLGIYFFIGRILYSINFW